MSDSAKLRFVYGILCLIGSFLCFGISIAIIFLLIFAIIPNNLTTIFLWITLAIFLVFFILAILSVIYFRFSGKIQGKDELVKQNSKK